jgi:hypothetical protein
VAGEQNTVISTRQLAACGLDSDAITVRTRRAQLRRVHRGVYAFGAGVLTLRGELTAAVLACGDGAVLSHRSAAAWWEMLAWDRREVEIIVPRGAGRGLVGIRPRWSRSLDQRDVWRRDNILVTSPARTVLDLGAHMAPKALRRMVRQSLAEGRVSVRQLSEVLNRSRRHPGARALRAVVADGLVPTRSDHEDIVLDLITQAGLQRPESNPRLRLDDRDIHPDLFWRDHPLAIECDSRRWHSDPLTQQDDADKQAILEAHGIRVLRVTWHQAVNHPRQTLRRIHAALQQVATAQ